MSNSIEKPRRLLMVYAHCDDELIWGHRFLCDPDIKKWVIACSCDTNNPKRPACAKQLEAFKACCRRAPNVMDFDAINQPSEFYQLPGRGNSSDILKRWWEEVAELVLRWGVGCDAVATHNPWGEYGMPDHLLVRRLVLQTTPLPVISTSAFCKTKTWPIGPRRIGTAFDKLYRTPLDQFDSLKAEYESRGCYTWSHEVPMDVAFLREE